jgi:hypothetical protein
VLATILFFGGIVKDSKLQRARVSTYFNIKNNKMTIQEVNRIFDWQIEKGQDPIYKKCFNAYCQLEISDWREIRVGDYYEIKDAIRHPDTETQQIMKRRFILSRIKRWSLDKSDQPRLNILRSYLESF